VSKRLFLLFVVLCFLVIALLPLLVMLFESVRVNGHLSLDAYAGLLQTRRQWNLMQHTLILASMVATLTTLVGVPLGILLGKTDLPFRRSLSVLFVVPLLLPPYIFAVSWSALVGGQEMFSDYLFGLAGTVFVLSTIYLPIPMLLTMLFLRTIDPRLEEAGRLVATWAEVMRGVTLPLLLPTIVLSFMVVAILTLGETSVADYLRYDVFAMESMTQFSAFYDLKAATAAALPLALAALLFLLVEEFVLRKQSYGLRAFYSAEMLTIELGTSRRWVLAIVTIVVALLVLLPLGTLLIQAGGLDSYIEAMVRAGESVGRSLLLAVSSATLLAFFGLFIGYLIHTKSPPIWRLVDATTIFLFALSGTVIGMGMISLWNRPWSDFVYTSPLIIAFGLLAKYTALTSKISAVQFAQIPASLEEAAAVAGAGWYRTMLFIVLPLAWRGLALAWIVGYLFSLRDTAVTMLVYPAGQDTLPVRILTLMANGSPELIAALCVIMIIITLSPLALFWLIAQMIDTKATS